MNRLRQFSPYLLLAPAILPLVYIGGVLYPYVVPKTLMLQGLGITALSAFVYLALSGQAFFYGRLRAYAAWIPAGLLFVEYATSIFGIDFYHSFWGLFERGDGLLTSSVIVVFFYLILLSADKPFFDRFSKTVAVVAGVVASIAVLQWIVSVTGSSAWLLPPVTGRIGSTIGNAAFLAGYLGIALFVIFFALRDATGAWRRIYKFAAALSILAIFFAATRGTVLALLLALLAALVYAAGTGEGSVRRFGRFGLAASVLLVALFFGFRGQLAQSSFEPIRRIASISLSDGTVSSRLFVWSRVWEETLRRPFSGYGAEHVARLFDKAYDPGSISEQWFDRSHNSFLDYFAQYGVFGLMLYLAFLGAFALYALRLYRREPPGLANPGFLFLLLILTYAVQNFFVFDTPHSFWLLCALFALLIAHPASEQTGSLPFRLPMFVPVLAGCIVLLALVPVVALPLYANVLLTKGYKLHIIDVKATNAYLKRGLGLTTYADLEYGYQAYSMYTDHQAPLLSGEDRIAAYEYALSVLSANFKKYPYDARTATYLGHVLDTTPPEVAEDDAFQEQVLVRAIELSPLRAQAWYMMANIFLRKADRLSPGDPAREKHFREAIAILELYAQKEASLPVARYTLAMLYLNLGDRVAAKKWADEAYPLYTHPDVAAAGPAVKYYLAVEDWQRARHFLADMVAKRPSDYDALYDLAKVTYLAGDPAGALSIVETLREKDPAILGTDQNFLAAISAYERSKK